MLGRTPSAPVVFSKKPVSLVKKYILEMRNVTLSARVAAVRTVECWMLLG